jgi:hypothetical protein
LRCCRTSPRARTSAGNAASGPAVARAETGSGQRPARWPGHSGARRATGNFGRRRPTRTTDSVTQQTASRPTAPTAHTDLAGRLTASRVCRASRRRCCARLSVRLRACGRALDPRPHLYSLARTSDPGFGLIRQNQDHTSTSERPLGP